MSRPCTTAVRDFLEEWGPTTSAAQCDLYTITLSGGEVLRYSGWQDEVEAPAPETDSPLITFPREVRMKRSKTKLKLGIEVDELQVEFYAKDDDLILSGGSITWQEAVKVGLFDGATFELWRCFMSPPGTVIGTIVWFSGRIADVEAGRTKMVMNIKSLLDMLNVQMPRRLFQAACTHDFGGEMCGFDRTTMAQDIVATSGSLRSQIHYSGPAPDPDKLFNNGTLVGVSGPNTGYRRTINQIVGGVVYLLEPWVFSIGIGDEFQMLPGCDHTMATCADTFDNFDHYGGFPYVPPPENAV